MMRAKQFNFEAIGTDWEIEAVLDTLDDSSSSEILTQIQDQIEHFDSIYSRFREDSLVSDLSQSAGTYRLPDSAQPMMKLYKKLYDLSDGLFTPMIGNVLIAAGYDADYSLQPRKLESPPAWDDTIEYVPPDITMLQPVMLDFGAVGKGYLIDLIANVLRNQQVEEFHINAGGDILQNSTQNKHMRVGLEHPTNFEQVIGVVDLGNQAIASSAGNRRAWGGYHHIMNPQTMSPAGDILASWVVASSAMLADALATGLFFVPASKLMDEFEFEYLILDTRMMVEKSSRFGAELFYT